MEAARIRDVRGHSPALSALTDVRRLYTTTSRCRKRVEDRARSKLTEPSDKPRLAERKEAPDDASDQRRRP